jgi:hypothetical protein
LHLKRVTLFAKGNVDVHDSLHSCRIAGQLRWNGVNAVMQERFPDISIRVKHETFTRTDALRRSAGAPPDELTERNLKLGPYALASQFSPAIFESDPDAFVISIQPDLSTSLVASKSKGYLFYPWSVGQWDPQDRQWLRDHFDVIGPPSPDKSLENLEAIVGRIRERSAAPILVYNISTVVPGETTYSLFGFDEIYSIRAQRMNLALAEYAMREDIAIVDVESIIARAGADQYKLDAIHLNPEGYALVAGEVVRILDELGVFCEDR